MQEEKEEETNKIRNRSMEEVVRDVKRLLEMLSSFSMLFDEVLGASRETKKK